MSTPKKSLYDRYPRRYEVPLLILASCVLLGFGLSLPLVFVKKMIFWKNEYSVVTGAWSLVQQREFLLAAVLFFFSLVFPIAKLIGLAVLWFARIAEEQRQNLLRWLGILGRWSMLDVFVVAILIVAVKLRPMANVEPRMGIYIFCIAIISSMLTTAYVDRLARK